MKVPVGKPELREPKAPKEEAPEGVGLDSEGTGITKGEGTWEGYYTVNYKGEVKGAFPTKDKDLAISFLDGIKKRKEAPPERPAEEVVVEYGEEPVPKDTKGLINALDKPEKHDRGEVIDALEKRIDEYGADTKGLLESIGYPTDPKSKYIDPDGNTVLFKDISKEVSIVRGSKQTKSTIDTYWFEAFKPVKGQVEKPEAPPSKVASGKEVKIIDEMLAEYKSQGGTPTKEALAHAIETNEWYSSLGESLVRGEREGLSKEKILSRFEELNPDAISSEKNFSEIKNIVKKGRQQIQKK